jgi:hypothetical protein
MIWWLYFRRPFVRSPSAIAKKWNRINAAISKLNIQSLFEMNSIMTMTIDTQINKKDGTRNPTSFHWYTAAMTVKLAYNPINKYVKKTIYIPPFF